MALDVAALALSESRAFAVRARVAFEDAVEAPSGMAVLALSARVPDPCPALVPSGMSIGAGVTTAAVAVESASLASAMRTAVFSVSVGTAVAALVERTT